MDSVKYVQRNVLGKHISTTINSSKGSTLRLKKLTRISKKNTTFKAN
jgi:hypothetical protein